MGQSLSSCFGCVSKKESKKVSKTKFEEDDSDTFEMSEVPKDSEDGSPGSVSHGKSGGSQGFGQDGAKNEKDEETWKFKCRFCNHSAPHNSDNALTGSEEFCPYYLRRYLNFEQCQSVFFLE